MPETLSIIIPSLRCGLSLQLLFKNVATLKPSEIIVATPEPQNAMPPTLEDNKYVYLSVPKGRGAALSAGAKTAMGEWLLFLHDDTILNEQAPQELMDYVSCPDNQEKAGYFKFKQDKTHFKARLLEVGVGLRCRLFALPYGDQGLLIHRALYEEIGGYRADYPFMEDLDIIQKLGRKRLHAFNSTIQTSSARYNDGYIRRVKRNMGCLTQYYGGAHPEEIVQSYQKC